MEPLSITAAVISSIAGLATLLLALRSLSQKGNGRGVLLFAVLVTVFVVGILVGSIFMDRRSQTSDQSKGHNGQITMGGKEPTPTLEPRSSRPPENTAEPSTDETPLKSQDQPEESDEPKTTPMTSNPVVVKVKPTPEHQSDSAEPKTPSEHKKELFAEGIGIKLMAIEAGEFMMGSPDSDNDAKEAEKPQHLVRITRPFWMAAHEVTVGQFRAFVKDWRYVTIAERDRNGGTGYNAARKTFERHRRYTWRNPGFTQDDSHPVVNVTWYDAVDFCKWLSRRDGRTFRLPTEAEWEYCCRAGTRTRFYAGDSESVLQGNANLADISYRRVTKKAPWATPWNDGFAFTAPVGRFRPNAWGLHDMDGNVAEWCRDWFAANYYRASSETDPGGPVRGTGRVLRGGGWQKPPDHLRSAHRGKPLPNIHNTSIGFRVVAERSPSNN